MDPRLVDMLGSIASVWALELLLLVRRDAARRWREGELVAELRSSNLVVRQCVERLRALGLLVEDEDGTVVYSPATHDLETVISQIDAEYRARPTAVRRIIVTPQDKLKSFSDAFLLRKPPK